MNTLTPEKAVQTIKNNWPPENYTILREALTMAIEALQSQPPTVTCDCGRGNAWTWDGVRGKNICSYCGKIPMVKRSTVTDEPYMLSNGTHSTVMEADSNSTPPTVTAEDIENACKGLDIRGSMFFTQGANFVLNELKGTSTVTTEEISKQTETLIKKYGSLTQLENEFIRVSKELTDLITSIAHQKK
jgi:hypothetical protein